MTSTWRTVDELDTSLLAQRDTLLFEVAQEAGEEALTEDQRERIREGGPIRHVVRLDDAGRMTGYAVIATGTVLEAEPVLGTCDDALVNLLEGLGEPVRILLRQVEDDCQAQMESRGWHPARVLHHLVRDLPADPVRVVGVTMRTFVVGRDEPAWIAENNAAFAGHPSQGTMTVERLRRREHEPWFDPEGFLLFEDAGEIVASCWTKMRDTPVGPVGEIYVVSVSPSAQGRGLGRMATLAGLWSLYERGAKRGELFVESSNAAGRSLYAALGFTPEERVVIFEFPTLSA